VTRNSRAVVLFILLASLPAAILAAQDLPIPPHIRVEPLLRPVVADLLHRSETFRRQWLTIAAARSVRVVIVSAPPRLASAPRAHATLTRYASGLLRAVIEIPVPSEYAELLPHEFEHVIESIEGVDRSKLAAAGGQDVMELPDGAFETGRAREAGRTASQEVHGDTDPAVTRAIRHLSRIWRAISDRGVPAASRPGPGPVSRR
jgi:hypothetical protein